MLGTSGRNDANSLGAVSTCCASAFALLRVQIACAISRTGGADLADRRCQTKNPASCEAGFCVWYQWPDSNRHAFKGGGF